MTPLNDTELERLVVVTMSRDSRVDLSEISVRVQGGVVHLTGTVDSAAERRAVQEDIEAACGMGTCVDDVSLRNFVERTDDELRAEVRRALIRDIVVDAGPVAIEATQGVVTLTGQVVSYAQKQAVESVTWWTPGVTDVVSQLQVDGLTEPPDDPDY